MPAVLDHTLQGAVALTTGAGGQIGRSICSALKAAGAQVVAADITDAPKDLNADDWIQYDVTSEEGWTHAVDRVRSRYGRLDCLINSAGICPLARIADTSLEQWRKVMSVNVESVFLGMRATLPLLRESGRYRHGGSSIVNISSTAGVRGVANFSAYCASKGAVTLLTISAAKEFASLQYPVRANSVHPGTVDSPLMAATFDRLVEVGVATSAESAKALFTARNPMGRMAQAEEIAGAVVFLCSPAASHMTGAKMVIDGGATA